MSRRRLLKLTSLAFSTVLLQGTAALAFPGFFAGKRDTKRVERATHVVLMHHGETTVVTVMPDYEGPLDAFAVVMPLPADVTPEAVRTIRRDFVDHVEQITAPRFHEFWEMDPCEPGGAQQEWERDLTAQTGTAFLSGDMPNFGSGPKLAPEMRLTVEPQFKDGEYTFHLLDEAESKNAVGWLGQNGYVAPPGAAEALTPYADSGMRVLVAEVNPNKVELAGSNRAILSPIRYATKGPVKIASHLGLLNLADKQELFVYVLHPDQRFEVKNYPNVFPPTNIEVDFKVKERMGEFYAGLHDLLLARNPRAFLVEYAWHTKGCGQPCPIPPLGIHEILSLGADVFEETVPKEERQPEPPDLTQEDEDYLDSLKDEKDLKKRKEKKKQFEETRVETARRKALLSRHNYLLSRMHYRYDKATLPADVEVGPAGPMKGGVDTPKGPEHELPTNVTQSGENRLQVRYTFFHPNIRVINCDAPERWRWGKAPRDYRGLRKIWIAQDLATKDRKEIRPAQMVRTPIPALGLKGGPAPAASASGSPSASASAAEGATKAGCGCGIPGRTSRGGSSPLLGLAAAAGAVLVRLRRR